MSSIRGPIRGSIRGPICGSIMLATWLICSSASTMAFATMPVPAPLLQTEIEQHLPAARVAGSGSFRWFGLKIYDATLSLGSAGLQVDGQPFSAQQPLALELVYARTLQGERIAESSKDEMEKLGVGTATQRQSWLATMKKIFPDVREGTRLTGIYLPNTGARFYLNGTHHGDIPDAEFARAFFAIWLDRRTSAPDLRTALLRNAKP